MIERAGAVTVHDSGVRRIGVVAQAGDGAVQLTGQEGAVDPDALERVD